MSEQSYLEGQRAAALAMMKTVMVYLKGNEDFIWIGERQEAIQALRSVCGEFGDNDWPDDLHLADVIEKHLHRHLEC